MRRGAGRGADASFSNVNLQFWPKIAEHPVDPIFDQLMANPCEDLQRRLMATAHCAGRHLSPVSGKERSDPQQYRQQPQLAQHRTTEERGWPLHLAFTRDPDGEKNKDYQSLIGRKSYIESIF